MYTEEDERRQFPIRAVLFKMVIIIIIIMLIVWLFPTSLFNNKKLLNKHTNTMKEAALSYYTDEKLPIEKNEKTKITLNKMIELNLVEELTYGSDKKCDTEASYVEVKKLEDDYLMTIYVKCGLNKKTTEIKINKYDHCDTTLCENNVEQTETPTCSLTVSKGDLGVHDWYRSDVIVKINQMSASIGADITDYGISTKKNNTYNNKKEHKVTKDGTTKVYGYVKDSNGKEAKCSITINKDTKKPSCTLATLNNQKTTNDIEVGFENKKDDLSGIDIYGISTSKDPLYNSDETITLTKKGQYTLYGYVKDKAGNTNVCNVNINKKSNTNTNNNNNNNQITSIISNNSSSKNNTKNNKLSCQLEVHKGTKNKNGIYTSEVIVKFKNITTIGSEVIGYGIGKKATYAKNSSYKITDNGVHTVYGYVKTKDNNTTKCSIKIHKDSTTTQYEYSKTVKYSKWSEWKEAEYNPSNPPKFEKTSTKEVENLGKKETNSYVYSVGSAIYLNKLDKINTLTESICKGYDYYRIGKNTYAVANNQKWTYQGIVTQNTTPTETINTKYVFDRLDWNCKTCTTPNILWKKYTRTTLTVVNNNTLKTSSGSTINCDSLTTGSVEVYNNYRQIVAFNQKRKATTKTIYLYRYRTRTLLDKPYVDYKYSVSKQDKSLLDQGYKLTGKTIRR